MFNLKKFFIITIICHQLLLSFAFESWYNEIEKPHIVTLGSVTPLSGPSPDLAFADFGFRVKRAIKGLNYEIPLGMLLLFYNLCLQL
ncbi:hypothetical protein FF38_06447 [Lucilia cuprina]|uniref:Uncharacterized protein n=1 Tax=Lucilia cuprina TaxID=7375 RepID=A0A0L0CP44_LUCCU|nr:hypothetical protein FF38_06447 [Lucilia cuprina]